MKMKLNGTALWACVRTPEKYQGNELGYSIQVKMEDDALERFENTLLEMLGNEVEHGELKGANIDKKTQPNLPIKETQDGTRTVKAKTKHFYINKTTGERIDKILPIFDKYGKPLPKDVLIGNGSVVQVSVEAKPYVVNRKNWGVALYLNAVLVKELVEYNGGQDATQYGFDIEEQTEDGGEEMEF